MERLTEHMLESAFDLHAGGILEDSLDAMKLTDEELEQVTGSQWPMMYPGMGYGGGGGYGGFGAGYSSTTTFSTTTSSFYGGGGGYGGYGGYSPWM